MASDVAAPLHNPDNADGLPWVAVVAIDTEDVATLPVFLTALKQNAVMPGFHICIVTDVTIESSIAAHLGCPDADSCWSVISSSRSLNDVAAITEAAGRYPGWDIVLLAADTALPFAWDARLRKAAYAESHIAAATAMCDLSPMFALVEGEAPPGAILDPVLIDRTAYAMGNRSYYEVPRVHASCTYFRRDALDAGLVVAGNPQNIQSAGIDALTMRLRALGWSCVLCDFLYVGIKQRLTCIPPTDDIEELAFRQNHPLGGLRRAVMAAIREGIASVSVPGLDARPVQLHIMHFWGGGLDKWVRDFGRADPSCINLVFSSFRIGETGGQRLVLYSDPVDPNPIRVWDIAQPIRSTLSSSIEYRRILQQIIREFEVETVFVSSLIGHTLDAVNQPLKTIVVCHDFYPVCQAINPQFGKTCERCTLDDLRTCAKSNPLNSIFVDQTSEAWHSMRSLYVERLLANKIEMVVPSPSVGNTLKRLSPRMAGLTFHVIAHGIDMKADPLPIATRTAIEPLRLVVLGRLSQHKGTELLRAACNDLRSFAQITLVGCGGNGVKLAQACGWNYLEKYEPADLPAILQKLAPHAGLLPSVIPETFSYTLSELNCLGVPTLATALGSFNDRIVDGESGFLFPPTSDGLVALVKRLHEQPQLLTKLAENLHAIAHHRSVAEMVGDYRALVPSSPRPIARFRVGVGMQTGLTEPYRHLTEAYGQLTGAYEHTKRIYETTRVERDDLTAICDQWVNDFDGVNLRKRWWRIRRALRLMEELREKLRRLKRAGAKNQQSASENSRR